MKPPKTIDGAKVLEWAWSGDFPFGYLPDSHNIESPIEIFGLAICRYPDSAEIYRFSCNKNWETEQDSPFPSIEEARKNVPTQYQLVTAMWEKLDE